MSLFLSSDLGKISAFLWKPAQRHAGQASAFQDSAA